MFWNFISTICKTMLTKWHFGVSSEKKTNLKIKNNFKFFENLRTKLKIKTKWSFWCEDKVTVLQFCPLTDLSSLSRQDDRLGWESGFESLPGIWIKWHDVQQQFRWKSNLFCTLWSSSGNCGASVTVLWSYLIGGGFG